MRPTITVRRTPRIAVRLRGASVPLVSAAPAAVAVIQVAATGRPGPSGADGASIAHNHVQSSPSDTWLINHNLNFLPSVSLRSAGGVEMVADIVHVSVNQTVIHFVVPVAGTARLV